jgi:hypothetical protein
MLKKANFLLFIFLLIFSNSCEGPMGEDGQNGTDGSTWYSGDGIPSNSLGLDGDYYLDTSTSNVYLKENGVWIIQLSIKGDDGATWHIGDGVPQNDLGNDGDFYLDYTTSDVYKKENNSWQFLMNIKGQDGNYDKEIRIPFPAVTHGTWDTTWYIQRHAYSLFDFNIENYFGLDSVIFSVATEMQNVDDTCFVRLFNYTDSVVINSSFMWSTNEELTRIRSGNIFNELPKKNIDIALSIRGHIPEYGNMVSAKFPYLILYRK